MKIAFLGLGAMGSRMALRLVAAGHEVTVWNRTPRRVDGAAAAATAAAAVPGAKVVIAMLRDDAASAAVWNEAMAGMAPGALGIEMSTVTPAQARALHDAAAARGLDFLDAPVAGSRPQAEAGQLIFMAGGEASVLAQAEPLLRDIGAAVHHAGGPGAGAMVKLMVNSLFGAQVAVIAELLGMAANAGIDPARAVDILAATPVAGPAAKAAAAAMLARGFAPAFPIDLVEKDFALARRTGEENGSPLPVTAAVHAVFAAAKSEGYGADNITGVVQRYLTR
ncbi:MAG: NAD(P)-dependent oxidoreductase [Tabrizicola sp.]|nr:NAD(P)-dependent oxidoreductase [Tabrizicola sp.]